MTTFDPGAIVVFTQGLVVRPFSTALRASNPAASITEGFDVLVHDVMAAITTWPWSRSNAVPSARRTGTRWWGRPVWAGSSGLVVGSGSAATVWPSAAATGSLAGTEWAAAFGIGPGPG